MLRAKSIKINVDNTLYFDVRAEIEHHVYYIKQTDKRKEQGYIHKQTRLKFRNQVQNTSTL